MPKFIIELNMDGYETKEEEIEACAEFIEEQLNFSASSVKILEIIKEKTFVKEIWNCGECEYFDSDGGTFEYCTCEHTQFPRDKNGHWIYLNKTIDIELEKHELCPLIKSK